MACALLLLLALFWPQNSDMPEVKFGTTVVSNSGFKGTIYKINKYSLQLPSKFSRLKQLGVIYTDELNVPPQDFRQGFPGVTKRTEGFAIDYTGKFWVAAAGRYWFSLESDDGSKLYIDDRVVVDNDGVHPPATKQGTVDLTTGIHTIRVSYFQGPRYSVALVLRVITPGAHEWKIFNMNEFSPPSDWKPQQQPQ